jgi:hypothetical protein
VVRGGRVRPGRRAGAGGIDQGPDRPGRRTGGEGGGTPDVGLAEPVSLPGDPLLQQSVEWSKQNLADSVQEARDLHVFVSNEGKQYPPPAGVLDKIRWIGAGWPDYPWLFATDGEYTAFAAVAAGQFGAIKNHLRALRDVSEIANNRSGKVVHEVTPDGQVYFGANADKGNTDETVKFPARSRWCGGGRVTTRSVTTCMTSPSGT